MHWYLTRAAQKNAIRIDAEPEETLAPTADPEPQTMPGVQSILQQRLSGFVNRLFGSMSRLFG